MERKVENMLKQLQRFMEAHESEFGDDQSVEALTQRFMEEYNKSLHAGNVATLPETSDDFLDLAETATSKKKRKEYLQKSVELDPDNLDAACMLADLEAKSREELLLRLQPLLDRGKVLMDEGGFFRDSMGDFWSVIETRPYMRLRYMYMRTLEDCGMMRKAAKEGEELLELSEEDNIGVRYDLAHIYAVLENEDAATLLFDEYGSQQDTQMLLPLAVLYYKLADFDKSLSFIKQLCKANKDTKKFIRAVAHDKIDEYEDQIHPYRYQPGTISELLIVLTTYLYLYDSVETFFEWAQQALKSK